MKANISLCRSIPFALACAMFVTGIYTIQADAAVRLCRTHVTSKVFSAESERDAKRQAIKDWTKKARASGLAHPSWRIAGYKVLKCVPRSGLYECVAHGAPCTIKQKVPPRKKNKPREFYGGEAVDA